jgi:hypothetical protein
MGEKGLELHDLFRQVNENVYYASDSRQNPVTYGDVAGRFYFREPDGPLPPPTIVSPTRDSVRQAADAPPKLEVEAVGLPTPTSDFQPGTWKYKANIEMGARKIALEETTTIKEENGAWTVTNTVDTPMGQMTDSATLDMGTLILRKRSVKQGPLSIELAVEGNKASGSLNMNGKETPIAADLGGPLFADAAGPQCIALLPLADGYTTTFRNFDLQKQKVKLIALKVTGSESVTVPAGTFDAFKVELSSADGGSEKQTLWIAKNPRKAVKIAAVLAEMGGATLTAELE